MEGIAAAPAAAVVGVLIVTSRQTYAHAHTEETSPAAAIRSSIHIRIPLIVIVEAVCRVLFDIFELSDELLHRKANDVHISAANKRLQMCRLACEDVLWCVLSNENSHCRCDFKKTD